MGFYEISTGLGMIIGPLLGGWLYSIGGFALPFYVVGGMMLFGAVLNLFLVPTVSSNRLLYELSTLKGIILDRNWRS